MNKNYLPPAPTWGASLDCFSRDASHNCLYLCLSESAKSPPHIC